ncbi:MAG: Nif3-like dinuclear metal center hexameric protein [Gammaproteobacteria bacterium]|nr:Nif3-like dinuclear metal center hexameric protein [Gammaproteobacteria bacterium]MDH5653615.1 Nif3-like dinuclear metal center hexameric protein [Gammaproteobacteria bacterium]
MVQLAELLEYTNKLLEIDRYQDYGPNGLQVEGKPQINKIISGVTASRALIDAAIAAQADAILVHHGYFWKGEDPCLTGMKGDRIRRLIKADLSLLAYHLPLDAHAELGNNARLASLLGITTEGRFIGDAETGIGMHGSLPESMSGAALAAHISEVLGREPLYIAGSDRPIKRIAWCSGGAQGYIQQALALGVDAYITGEVSEHTVHTARECGIHFFSAGHHATERYGVQALGEHLANKFAVSHQFIDIDNPV